MREPADSKSMRSRRYAAFVSYSHADREAGGKLFRILDGYRTPKALVGAKGAAGPVPPRLYPCFRDREELAVSRDVRAGLDDALKASENLVVLCSEAAARSTWVAHEIRQFAALNGVDRIHVVLASGEPDLSLPSALGEVGVTSPLFSDLRPHADGWRDGPLKVIAAILGVPFGALKDREQERIRARRRATTMVAASFSTLLLTACGTGWVALERSERLQRSFVDIIRQVSERTTHAFDEQGVSLTTGDIARELEIARILTRAAFAIAPDSPLLLLEECRVSIVHARHLMALGRPSDALREIARSNRAFSRLGPNPGIQAMTMEAIGLRVEATALLLLGKDQTALDRLRRSEMLLSEIRVPEAYRETALTKQALGALAERDGRYGQASRYYSEASQFIALDISARGENDSKLRNDAIVSIEAIGDLLLRIGHLDAARASYVQANAMAVNQAESSPSMEAERTLYVTYDRLGQVALLKGELKEAEAHFLLATQLAEKLWAQDAGSSDLGRDTLRIRLRRAQLAASLGMLEEARTQAQAVVQETSVLAQRDHQDVNLQTDLARARITSEMIVAADLRTRFMWNDLSLLRKADTLGVSISPGVRKELQKQREPMVGRRRSSDTPVVNAPD